MGQDLAPRTTRSRQLIASASARRVVTPDGILEDHEVRFADGLIVDVAPCAREPSHALIAAGFVDIQVNGHDDVDVASVDAPGWERLGTLLAATGVTSWCPTLISAPTEVLDTRMANLVSLMGTTAGPQAVGIHLEGPFLGAARGAHAFETEGPIDRGWIADLPPEVVLMTLGPERDGAERAIEMLTGAGVVVALGHTAADHRTTEAMVDAGARLFTHAFNASGVLHHRNPGALGVALTDDRIVISVIADGIHVDPMVLRLAWRAKPSGGIVLITDAVTWGAGRLGDAGVTIRDGAPRLADGTLAGSTLRMNDAVRFCVDEVGIELVDALAAASSNPAGVLGLDDRGRIIPGLRADLVALTDDLEVSATWVGGEPAVCQPAGEG